MQSVGKAKRARARRKLFKPLLASPAVSFLTVLKPSKMCNSFYVSDHGQRNCSVKSLQQSLLYSPNTASERSKGAVRGSCAAAEEGHLTHQVLPLSVQVRLVGQAALHDVQAVVVARLHAGHAPAVRAVHQLHDGASALVAERYLRETDGSQAGRLVRGACGQTPPFPRVKELGVI